LEKAFLAQVRSLIRRQIYMDIMSLPMINNDNHYRFDLTSWNFQRKNAGYFSTFKSRNGSACHYVCDERTIMFKISWNACLSLVLLCTAFRSVPAQQNRGLDINDVAVLFPLDSHNQALPKILLSGPKTELIPQKIYAELWQASKAAGIAAPFLSSLETAEGWAIVGYRVDPCAPQGSHAPNGPCTAEIRLIAQPLTPENGPSDTALHLIYDIEDSSRLIYQEILNLKTKAEALSMVSTNGKPLGVHPLLALAAMNSNREVPALHSDFLTKFVDKTRLKKVTIMGLRDAFALDWIFLGGDVIKGKWIQGKIPNLASGQDNFVEFDLRVDPNPFTSRPLDSRLSTYDFFSTGVDTTEAIRQTLAEAAHRLENPELSNRNTADCLSCHSATTMRIHAIAQMPFIIQGLTAKNPKGITAFPEPLTLQNHNLNWNLRAFGYFDQRATLSMRTVNEAARSADAINKALNRVNPGPDCSAVEDEVQTCFVKTSTEAGPQKSTEECLSLCEAAIGPNSGFHFEF
jgi:hypothetical protein